MFDVSQVEATERRYQARAKERTATKELLAAGGRVAANPRERVELRKRRISDVAPIEAILAEEMVTADIEVGDIVLERILGNDDTFNINYLALAARAASSVGRIRIRQQNGRAAGYGTGFLVAPRLLLTNNHVLEDARMATSSLVDFDYEDDIDGRPKPPRSFALDPTTLFVTDAGLDFSLVAVAAHSQAGEPITSFGWSPLIEEQGKVLLGELVNIVQHPRGDRKRLGLRQNEVVDLLDLFVHYETDTSPGSSGSPVFNEQWEVVALHHSGVPRKEGDTILARGGGPWDRSMGDEAIDWIANEGVRISRIVAFLRDAALSGAAADLRDELLAGTANVPIETTAVATSSTATDRSGVAVRTSGPCCDPVVEVTVRVSSGTATVGGGTTTVSRATPVAPASLGGPEDAELAAALAEAEAAKTKPYYDAATDADSQTAYYAALAIDADPVANFGRVHDLLRTTHRTQLRYRPLAHVYPWVDLQPNRRLRSVYSGREFDPVAVIQEDFAIERLEAEVAERMAAESLGPEALEAFLEKAAPFNCEHVVPQSWFAKREPMKGDLHHLFTCEWGCNSFRGNARYHDFVDFEEKDRDECGRLVGDDFEPSAGKGAVARATLYFLVRYPGEVGDLGHELQAATAQTLIGWHGAFPVTEWERHRNAAIEAKQGNRNPFIDRPDLVDKLDWTLGFA